MSLGPECYYPPRLSISSLLNEKQALLQSNNKEIQPEMLQRCLRSLQYWKSACSYKSPPQSEESCCRPNLDLGGSEKVSYFQLQNMIESVIEIPSNFDKPVIMCRRGRVDFGLIASEAKALDSSKHGI